jgi:hypothetical protein
MLSPSVRCAAIGTTINVVVKAFLGSSSRGVRMEEHWQAGYEEVGTECRGGDAWPAWRSHRVLKANKVHEAHV